MADLRSGLSRLRPGGFEAGENQVVFARLSADLDTPGLAHAEARRAGQRDAFDSRKRHGGEVRGRYSIIGVKPDIVWECRGDDLARYNRAARLSTATASSTLEGPSPRQRLPGPSYGESRDRPARGPAPPPAAGLFRLSRLRHDPPSSSGAAPRQSPRPLLGLPDRDHAAPLGHRRCSDGVKGLGKRGHFSSPPTWAGSGLIGEGRLRPGGRAGDWTRCATSNARPRSKAAASVEAAPDPEPVSNFARGEDYLAAVE